VRTSRSPQGTQAPGPSPPLVGPGTQGIVIRRRLYIENLTLERPTTLLQDREPRLCTFCTRPPLHSILALDRLELITLMSWLLLEKYTITNARQNSRFKAVTSTDRWNTATPARSARACAEVGEAVFCNLLG